MFGCVNGFGLVLGLPRSGELLEREHRERENIERDSHGKNEMEEEEDTTHSNPDLDLLL